MYDYKLGDKMCKICRCTRNIECGGAYWEGRAVACSLFMPNEQALLIALPLFFLQIDFSSISY